MIKRLAVVIWCLGALLLLAMLVGQFFVPRGPHVSELDCIATLGDNDAFRNFVDNRIPNPWLRPCLEARWSSPAWSPANRLLLAAAGIGAATCCWTLAFVLGGTFWRPSKR